MHQIVTYLRSPSACCSPNVYSELTKPTNVLIYIKKILDGFASIFKKHHLSRKCHSYKS